MKYNDRELAYIGQTGAPVIEGRMGHQKPPNKDWSDWMTQPTFKDRWFKLKSNLLFYYKIGDGDHINYMEPVGVFVLEHASIQVENSRQVPFAFSMTFQDEPDKKHIFSCRSEENACRWMAALKEASYEYLRTQLIIIEKKLSMRRGEDGQKSVLGSAKALVWTKLKGFKCHLNECSKIPHRIAPTPPSDLSKEFNLIDL